MRSPAVDLLGRIFLTTTIVLLFSPRSLWLVVAALFSLLIWSIHFLITMRVKNPRERYLGEAEVKVDRVSPEVLVRCAEGLGFRLTDKTESSMRFRREKISGKEIVDYPGSRARVEIFIEVLADGSIHLKATPPKRAYIGVSLWSSRTNARVLLDRLLSDAKGETSPIGPGH